MNTFFQNHLTRTSIILTSRIRIFAIRFLCVWVVLVTAALANTTLALADSNNPDEPPPLTGGNDPDDARQALTDGNDPDDKRQAYLNRLRGLAEYDLTQAAGILATDGPGLELARSLADCALGDHDTIALATDTGKYRLEGRMNLAPGWKSLALTQAERELVSACVMAHTSYYSEQMDIDVVIDARGPQTRTGSDMDTRFSNFEGAFYGDLFGDSATAYVCSGDAAPDFEAAYPDHDPTAGDRLLRRCTDDDGSGVTMCGFIYTGACEDVCGRVADGSYTDCRGGEQRYRQTMSVWLLSYDDAAAIWTEFYQSIFG